MKSAYLSNRLQLILDQAIPNEPLWDVCCDHGLLSEAALFTEKFPYVFFVDQVPSITDRLEKRLLERGHDRSKYQVLTTDGGKITQEIFGTFVIAGVGADTQVDMIRSLTVTGMLKASRLVLNPFKDLGRLETDLGPEWKLSQKIPVQEGPRERTVFVFDRLS